VCFSTLRGAARKRGWESMLSGILCVCCFAMHVPTPCFGAGRAMYNPCLEMLYLFTVHSAWTFLVDTKVFCWVTQAREIGADC
jgi:hypothetical protein